MLTVLWIFPFDMDYRGTSVLRNNAPLGPYSRKMPGGLWRPKGGGLFLMSEAPLCTMWGRFGIAFTAGNA